MSALKLSFGNSKLPKTTAIFNMQPAFQCSSDMLGLCKLSSVCYAKKAERLYPPVLPYRKIQQEYWLNCTPDQFVADFIQLKKKATNKLRFNESGDFKTQNCVDKAESIAKKLKEFGIITYIYTARNDLNFTNCHNLIINASGFEKNGINAIFKAVKKYTDKSIKCIGDCKKCNLCSTKRNKQIVIEVLEH